MSQSRKPFLVGLFIFSGLLLFIASLLVLTRDSLFSRPTEYAVYFTGALDGLSVGADVTYRGVKIGSVQDVHLTYDERSKDVVMPVIIRITNEQATHASKAALTRLMDELIERGLRAQLQTPSLLTGKAIVALDFFTGQDGYVYSPNIIGLPVIPSVPTKIDEVEDMLRHMVDSFKEIPLKDTIASANQSLISLDKLLNSPDLQQGLENFNTTLKNFAEISTQLQQKAPNVLDSVQDSSEQLVVVMKEMRAAAEQAQEVLERIDTLVAEGQRSLGPQSELQYELLNALQNVGQASKAIQRTAESIEQEPQSLIFGKSR